MHKFIGFLLIVVIVYKSECRIIRTTEGWFNVPDEVQHRINIEEDTKYPIIVQYNEADLPRIAIDAKDRCPEGFQKTGNGECVPVFG